MQTCLNIAMTRKGLMKFKVCIAEKPSVARDIAKVLGANKSHEGYLEGNGYQVTWTYGHLCTLKEPNDYNEMWQHWNLGALPMIPQRFGIKLIDSEHVKKQFAVIDLYTPEEEELVELIKDYIYIEEKDIECYNTDKIKACFNIPNDAHLMSASQSGGSYIWRFKEKDSDKTHEVDVYSVLDKSKVAVIKHIKTAYVNETEIAYWRKDYTLEKKMYDACDHTIRNCGYYPLNNEMIKIVLKDKTQIVSREELTSTEDVIICYVEWY